MKNQRRLAWILCVLFIFCNTGQASYLFPLAEPMYLGKKIRCTSWYSKWRTEMINGKKTTYQYRALNYPAQYGSDVLASGNGIVTLTQCDGYEGLTITIRYDDGLTIKVCHLSKQMVLEDTRVKRGQVIGKVGRSGRTTDHHLRVVTEINGERVFAGAETWGLKYDDIYYDQTTFDQANTTMYANGKA